jgi:protein-S-isoprenylcysteine O-methyltransferase Ste14
MIRRESRIILIKGVGFESDGAQTGSRTKSTHQIASLIDSVWLLDLALPLMVTLQKGVIEPEERYLEQRFGERYLRFKTWVRRWI